MGRRSGAAVRASRRQGRLRTGPAYECGSARAVTAIVNLLDLSDVRGFGDEGVRMTLGDPDENDVFLQAAAEVLVPD